MGEFLRIREDAVGAAHVCEEARDRGACVLRGRPWPHVLAWTFWVRTALARSLSASNLNGDRYEGIWSCGRRRRGRCEPPAWERPSGWGPDCGTRSDRSW